MFTFKKIYLLILISIGFCEAGYNITDDTLPKCSIKDTACHRKAIESIIQEAKNGIPDLGIPPMDPYEVKNTTISILGMVNLTMADGKVEGTTNCPFTKFDVDIDNGITNTESFCEQITMSGRYQILTGGIIKALIGDSVSGDGNGKIQIDKMTLKMKIPFSVEKINDDIILVPNASEAEYSTNPIENISFDADNVILGNREVSKELIGFMNRNWKMILRSFGKFFSDEVMDVFYDHVHKFFLEVPAKYYISDDLSSYVKS